MEVKTNTYIAKFVETQEEAAELEKILKENLNPATITVLCVICGLALDGSQDNLNPQTRPHSYNFKTFCGPCYSIEVNKPQNHFIPIQQIQAAPVNPYPTWVVPWPDSYTSKTYEVGSEPLRSLTINLNHLPSGDNHAFINKDNPS